MILIQRWIPDGHHVGAPCTRAKGGADVAVVFSILLGGQSWSLQPTSRSRWHCRKLTVARCWDEMRYALHVASQYLPGPELRGWQAGADAIPFFDVQYGKWTYFVTCMWPWNTTSSRRCCWWLGLVVRVFAWTHKNPFVYHLLISDFSANHVWLPVPLTRHPRKMCAEQWSSESLAERDIIATRHGASSYQDLLLRLFDGAAVIASSGPQHNEGNKQEK